MPNVQNVDACVGKYNLLGTRTKFCRDVPHLFPFDDFFAGDSHFTLRCLTLHHESPPAVLLSSPPRFPVSSPPDHLRYSQRVLHRKASHRRPAPVYMPPKPYL